MVDITADYYVAALPVEVMTSLLTDDLKRAAPSMANIGRLRTAWMNGIQFYLARRAPIVHGHIVYVDSPWALTSVSQDQFWDSIDLSEYGDGEVKGILSVDISDWETPGMLYGRPAKECDAVEIKNEVWLQILAHLDADGQKQLRDAKIMRWFLDPGIVFPNPSQAVNLEPLLINTVGSLANRPHAYTEITNLFLAADYVRTGTDLACMESANEAGRRAANALLDRAECPAPRAAIWPLTEPSIFNRFKDWDRLVFEQGAPHSLRSATWAAFRQWLPLGGGGSRGRRCRRRLELDAAVRRSRDNSQFPTSNSQDTLCRSTRESLGVGSSRRRSSFDRAMSFGEPAAALRQAWKSECSVLSNRRDGRGAGAGLRQAASPRPGEIPRTLQDASSQRRSLCRAFDERTPDERALENGDPAIDIAKEGFRESVADGRVAQHRSPQAAVIRRVAASPVRDVCRGFTGEAAAFERVVDAFTGQRVGEPAGVADDIDGTARRSQAEPSDRDPEGLHVVERVVARQSLRADV